MAKILEYFTVYVHDLTYLDDDVNEQIKEGWQPLGAPIYAEDSGYLQAMVKYSE